MHIHVYIHMYKLPHFHSLTFFKFVLELLGTPGYLAPEMLTKSVEPTAPGYNKEIDMYWVITKALFIIWHWNQMCVFMCKYTCEMLHGRSHLQS